MEDHFHVLLSDTGYMTLTLLGAYWRLSLCVRGDSAYTEMAGFVLTGCWQLFRGGRDK